MLEGPECVRILGTDEEDIHTVTLFEEWSSYGKLPDDLLARAGRMAGRKAPMRLSSIYMTEIGATSAKRMEKGLVLRRGEKA